MRPPIRASASPARASHRGAPSASNCDRALSRESRASRFLFMRRSVSPWIRWVRAASNGIAMRSCSASARSSSSSAPGGSPNAAAMRPCISPRWRAPAAGPGRALLVQSIDDLLRSFEPAEGDQRLGEIGNEGERPRLENTAARQQSFRRVQQPGRRLRGSSIESATNPSTLRFSTSAETVPLCGGERGSFRCVPASTRPGDPSGMRRAPSRTASDRGSRPGPRGRRCRIPSSAWRAASGPLSCGALHLAQHGQCVVAHELEP